MEQKLSILCYSLCLGVKILKIKQTKNKTERNAYVYQTAANTILYATIVSML